MDDLTLYILMRTDLASLNPGKAMAQANHAYGALKAAIRSKLFRQNAYVTWMDQTPQEFGTTIVLAGTGEEIASALRLCRTNRDIIAGWVHDPTYPITDGEVTHTIPLNTCAFVFGSKQDCRTMIASLRLHP